ncbi:T6SS phospholipase effector Tle1-like catalytic domain-containing protein [Vibrio sinaloensis]|uniref:T6SS phospholipase effector Tle1-like catalytic domain-containing protein n=1 Tax=Photobacterium sp. (strain ATCC 43367) TaxID=379097 RepID=UPI00204C78CE|nr:DUF2235 domain-containing protein [Vibrio sinaloensis]UPQ89061.1 DUF2235 domain-containing protein [Vibrio sinaloensis]
MSSATGASPYCIPCEKKSHWIEIVVRDEFNQPFQNVSGVLIDGASNEYPITLGEAPILLEQICPGEVTLKLDSEPWLRESQGQDRKPNTEGNPTKDYADNYQGNKNSTPNFYEVTAGDLTELTEDQTLPTRHQKGKADALKLVADKSYVLKVRGFNFITLRVGMFFDGTGNNTYSAQWGKQQLDKYYTKWRQIFDANCEVISRRTGYKRDEIPITELSIDCFAYPEEESFFSKVFSSQKDDLETLEGSAANEFTNIQKLFDRYAQDVYFENQNTYAISEYITGIGTGNEVDIKPADESVFGMGTGIGDYGVVQKVNNGVEKIIKNIAHLKRVFDTELPARVDGIGKLKFDVFGFSRGAAAARHFINVATEGSSGSFAKLFSEECQKKKLGLPASFDWDVEDEEESSCEIAFAGLFDTVASIVHLISFDKKTLLDIDFDTHQDHGNVKLWLDPNRVRRVVHLTADPTVECRDNFSLNRINEGKNFVEITLPGAHSDIGGGYFSQATFPQDRYILPILENKLVKSVSRSFSDRWEKKRAVQYVYDKLRDYQLLDQRSGWRESDYALPEISIRKHGRDSYRVVGKLYIKRRVEGDLSRLYLRLMYGLAEFHGVPLSDDDGFAWNDDPYLMVRKLWSEKGSPESNFSKLNEKILKLAKQGNYDEIVSSLCTLERRDEFMNANLCHHSSSDNTGMNPLFNETEGKFKRASYECTKDVE